MESIEKNKKLISLQEATKLCGYTQEYLSLRARQGKLKAKKSGRNWQTTEEWLEDYLKRIEVFKNVLTSTKEIKDGKILTFEEKKKESQGEQPEHFFTLPTQPGTKARHFAFALVLTFFILGAGVVFGYPYFNDGIKNLGKEIKENFAGVSSGADKLSEKFLETTEEFSLSLFSVAKKTKNYIEDDKKFVGKSFSLISKETKQAIGKMLGAVGNFFDKLANLPKEKGESIAEDSGGISVYIREQLWQAKEKLSRLPSVFKTYRRIVFYYFSKAYNFAVRPWKMGIPEGEFTQLVKREDFEILKNELDRIKKEGVISKELVKEIQKITQILPVKEITKQFTKIDSEELSLLKADLATVKSWEADIDNLRIIASKLQAGPAHSQVITSPIYIGSQGLEVSGTGNFTSLAVSGTAGIANLGVGESATIGSSGSDQLTVNANADFNDGATFYNGLTAGSGLTYVTLSEEGDIVATGNVAVSGTLLVSSTSTLATTTITQLAVGTTTPSGIFSVATSTGASVLFVGENGNVGIGTTTPGYALHIIGEGRFTGDIYAGGNLNITGTTTHSGHLVPADDNTYDVGSFSKRFRSIYSGPNGLSIYNSNTSTTDYELGSLNFSSNILTLSTSATGTGSARPLQIKTGSNVGLYLDTNGNLGIGTTTPMNLLQIVGTTTARTILPETTDSYDLGSLLLSWNNIYSNNLFATSSNLINSIITNSTTTNATTTNLYVSGSATFAGTIGIGGINFNNQPGYNASYFQAGYFNATSTFGIASSTFSTAVGIGTTSVDSMLSIKGNGLTSYLNIASTTGAALYVGADGKVGIGTAAPSAKLNIQIPARTTAFSVGTTATWADVDIFNPTDTLNAASGIRFVNDATPGADAGAGIVGIKTDGGNNVYDLAFITDPVALGPAERMRITSNGNVGIGTTTPTGILSVASSTINGASYLYVGANGKVGIGTAVPTVKLSVNSGATAPTTIDLSNSIVIGAGGANTTNKFLGQIGFLSTDAGFTAPKIVAYISAEAAESYGADIDTASRMRFYVGAVDGTNPVERMVLDESGNVGIGTTAPGKLLHINQATTNVIDGVKLTADAATGYLYAGGSTYSAIPLWQDALVLGTDSNAGGGIVIDATTLGIRFAIANTEKVRIDSSGNVGIGTTSPQAKLHIETATNVTVGLILKTTDDTTNKNLLEFQDSAGAKQTWFSRSGKLYLGIGATVESTSPWVNLSTKQIQVGQDLSGTNTRTDSTVKVGYLTVPHYLNAEQPVEIFGASNQNGINQVLFGGGTSDYNAATVISFYTAADSTTVTGNERMRIDNNGNVGIGTTTMNSTFSVFASGTQPFLNIASTTATTFYIGADGKVGIGTADPGSYKLNVNGNTYSNNFYMSSGGIVADVGSSVGIGMVTNGAMTFYTSGWSNPRMTILTGGNVGIGTTSPTNLLHIISTGTAVGGTQLTLEGRYGGYGAGINFASKVASAGNLVSMGKVVVDGESSWTSTASTQDSFMTFHTTVDGTLTERLRITSSGNVGIGTTTMNSTFSVFASGTQPFLNIASSTATAFYIGADGKVGIGTASPKLKFDVLGNIRNSGPAISGTTPTGDMSILNDVGTGLYIGGYQSSPFAYWLQAANRNELSTLYPIVFNPLGGNVGIGTTTPNALFSMSKTAGSITPVLYISSTTQGDLMTITSDALTERIGFGTAAPESIGTGKTVFDVRGVNGAGVIFGSPTVRSYFTNTGSATDIGTWNDIPTRFIFNNDAEKARITPNGMLGLATSSPDAFLTIKGTSTTTPYVNIASTTATAFYIGADGKVGIGTASPLAKLDINTGGQATLNSLAGQIFLRSAGSGGLNAYGAGIVFSEADGATNANHGSSITSIQTTADTDTSGLTFNVHSANYSDDRVEAMRINEGGNVGIASSTPTALLSLTNSGTGPIVNIASTTATTFYIGADGKVGIGTSTPQANLEVLEVIRLSRTLGGGYYATLSDNGGILDISTFGTGAYMRFQTGGSERLRIDNGGNVGIGTTSPVSRLDVSSADSAVSDGITQLTLIDSSALAADVGAGMTFKGVVDGSGTLSTLGAIKMGKANASASDYLSYLSFYTRNNSNFSERMRIDNQGNVGIGNTSPTNLLDVGSTSAGGNASVNATLGTEAMTIPMASGGWTLGSDATGTWAIDGSGVLSKTVSAGNITATAVSGMSAPSSGVTYKVTITVSAVSAAWVSYTVGGTRGTLLTSATTYTDYITAVNTTKFAVTAPAAATISISSISVVPLTNVTGDLNVYGNLRTYSYVQNSYGTNVFMADHLGNLATYAGLRVGNFVDAAQTLNSPGIAVKSALGTVDSIQISDDAAANPVWARFGLDANGNLRIDAAKNGIGRTNIVLLPTVDTSTGSMVGIGTTTPTGLFSIQSTGFNATKPIVNIASSTATAFYIGADGKVGIGTASPVAPITITSENAGIKFLNAASGGTITDGLQFGHTGGGQVNGEMWNYENGYFRIGTNGAERLRILATGLVGIGTTSPSSLLSIQGTASTTDIFVIASSTMGTLLKVSANGNLFVGTSSTPTLYTDSFNGRVGIGTQTPSTSVQIVTPASGGEKPLYISVSDSADYFAISNGSGSDGRFVPTFEGTVESSATPSLYFYGRTNNASDTGTQPLINFQATKYGGATSMIQTRPLFSFSNYGTTVMLIDVNGKLGLSSSTPTALLSMTNSGTGPIVNIASTTATAFYIGADGNMGIGSVSSPSYRLYVNGSTYFNGGVYWAGSGYITYGSMPDGGSGFKIAGMGTNQLSFGAGGVYDRVVLTADGLFGIGTTTASAMLSVQGVASTTDLFKIASSTGATLLNFNTDGRLGIGSSTPQSLLSISRNGSVIPFLNIASTTGTALYVGANGNVGIGTASPVSLFDVNSKFNVLSSGNVGIGTTTNSGSSFTIQGSAPTQMFQAMSNTSAAGPMMSFYRSKGTTSSSTDVASGNVIAWFRYYTFNQSSYGTSRFDQKLVVDSAPSGSYVPLKYTMTIVDSGSVSQVPLEIRPTGDIIFGQGTTNTGIGTTTPSAKFDILGSSSSGMDLFNVSTSTGTSLMRILANGNVGISTANPAGLLDVGGGKLMVLSSGNVGIGDTTPDYPLEILSTTAPQLMLSYTDGVNYAGLSVDSNGYLTLDPSGNIVSVGGSTDTHDHEFRTYGYDSASTTNRYAYLTHTGSDVLLESSFGTGWIRFGNEATDLTGGVLLFGNSTAGENREFRVYGYNTTAAASSYGSLKYSDDYDALLLNTDVGHVQIGSAGTLNKITSPTSSDLFVSGRLEVDGATYFDGATNFYSTLSVDGTSTFAVTSGNVGIGTSTPTSLLYVQGSSITPLTTLFSVASSTGIEYLTIKPDGNVGIGTTSPTAALHVSPVSGYAGNLLTIASSTAAAGTGMVILNNGNVGIGTTVPGQRFHVSGNSRIDGILSLAPTQIAKVLEAADAADFDSFGQSVSLSSDGSILAVGAYSWEGAAGSNRGGVYIYDWSGSAWVQRGSVLEAADAANTDAFGYSVSLSSDGSILAVGANVWEGAAGYNRGGVYIYDWSGSAWVQRGSVLEAADAADEDYFGHSVSLSSDGSILAVGARAWEGAVGLGRGGVYIYDWSGSAWVQRGSVLEAADAINYDAFGQSVSLSSNGSILAVGARAWEGAAGTDRGGVYIYDWSGSAWVQRGSVLEASDAADSDYFSQSVSLSSDGSILVVGAYQWEGAAGTDRGGVYIYDWSGSAWVQRGSVLEASDAANGDYFSQAFLSSNGSILAVGANVWEGAAGDGRGGVYNYSLVANGELFATTHNGTGWNSFLTNNLVANTGGAERMRINSSGNVGIGTTSPSSLLSIQSTTSTTNIFAIASSTMGTLLKVGADGNLFVGTSSTPTLYTDSFNGRVGIGTTTPTALLSLTNSGTGPIVNIASTTATAFYIGADGKVGIGTAAPSNGLTLSGKTLEFSSEGESGYEIKYTGTSAFNIYSVGSASANTLHLGTSNTPRLSIDYLGNVGIGTTSPTGILSVASSTINGASYLYVGANGNIGIGTSTPNALLDVEGGAYFAGGTGDFDGNGQIQTSDKNSYLLKYLNGTLNFTPTQFAIGDINGDGKVNWDDHYIIGKLNGTTVGTSGYNSAKRSAIVDIGNRYGADSTTNGFKIVSNTNAAISLTSSSTQTSSWTLGIDSSDSYKFKIASTTILGTDVRFTIDSGGLVGIGTSSPSAMLSVQGTASTSDLFTIASSTGTTLLKVDTSGYLGIGDSTPDYPLEILSTTAPQLMLSYTDGVNYAGLSVDSNGYLTLDPSGNIVSVGGSTDTHDHEFRTYGYDSASTTNRYAYLTHTGSDVLLESSFGTGWIRFGNEATDLTGGVLLFGNSTAGENREFRVYGYNTTAAASSYGSLKYSDDYDALLLNTDVGHVQIGAAGTLNRITSPTSSDLFVSGKLEVDGATYFDGATNFYSTLNVDGTSTFAVTSGNVGIGTSTPMAKLHVEGGVYFHGGNGEDGEDGGDYFGSDLVPYTAYLNNKSSYLTKTQYANMDVNGDSRVDWSDKAMVTAFYLGGYNSNNMESFKKEMRRDIDALYGAISTSTFYVNGNVGVGVTSPSAKLEVLGSGSAPTFTLTGADGNIVTQRIENYANTSLSSSYIYFQRAKGTKAVPDSVIEGNSLGNIEFQGYSTTTGDFSPSAKISGFADGEFATNGDVFDSPGRLAFYTTPDGEWTSVERMRITSAGNVGIGITTSSNIRASLGVWGTAGSYDVVDFASSSGATIFRVDKNSRVGVGTTSPAALLTVQGISSSTDLFRIASSTGATLVTINNAGNVGIGTTSPVAALHVSPVSGYAGNLLTIASSTAAAGNGLTVTNSGNVGIGTTTNSGSNFTIQGTAPAQMFQAMSNTSAVGPMVSFYRSKGTTSSSTDVASGNVITWFRYYTFNQSSYGTSRFDQKLVVDSAPSGSYVPLKYTMTIVDSGSVSQVPLEIRPTGDIIFGQGTTNTGIGTTTPSAKFDILGSSSSGMDLFNVSTSTGTSLMRILANGNVGIGTTSPTSKLEIGGNFYASTTNGGFYITGLGTADATALQISAAGLVTKATSSRKYKTDIVKFDFDSKKILELNPSTFTWNERTATPGKRSFGLIAEEVFEVFPELVGIGLDGQPESVDYAKLSVILLKVMQEQQKKLDELSVKQDSNGTISNLSAEELKSGLANLGIVITETGMIEVGDLKVKNGLTLYDKITNEPYCVTIENGEIKTTAGECSVTNGNGQSAEVQPPVEVEPPIVEENTTSTETATTTECVKKTFFYDSDGDSFGNGGNFIESCAASSSSWVLSDNDCDDSSSEINPNAEEICDNGKDNDCDGTEDKYEASCKVEEASSTESVVEEATTTPVE